MKRCLFILLLVTISSSLFATEYVAPLSMYKDNYIIAGDKNKDNNVNTDNDQLKFQLSLKGSLYYQSGVFFGYTQLVHWIVYENRDTMFSQYMPELFYRFESGNNCFNNYVIPFVDYFQISPIYHCSTGVEDENHRSVNEYYGQVQISYGEVYNFGFNVRVFGYYMRAPENKDINDYKKNYEADVFFKLRSKEVKYLDKEELHIKFGGNPLNKGYISCQVIFRLLTTYIQPRIMFEYYNGYDEFMVYYKEKEEAYRIGFIF